MQTCMTVIIGCISAVAPQPLPPQGKKKNRNSYYAAKYVFFEFMLKKINKLRK